VKQWVKKSSLRMIDSNGRPFEYHWYEKAGQKFEIKKKFLDI